MNLPNPTERIICRDCDGTGLIDGDRCLECDGEGVIDIWERTRTLQEMRAEYMSQDDE